MTDYRSAWTEEQETMVHELWVTHSAGAIAEKVGHTKMAVKRKASRLGLTKPDLSWTDEEIVFLRKHLPTTGTIIIADQLGRSKSSVTKKAKNLGLRIPRLGSWSEENDAVLRDLWLAHPTVEIAKIIGRAKNFVFWRALMI